ncbi:isoleucine--tRNA ligase [Maridesulfovibrio hydrothermalis]|uniref:Isoleucine--tRNA ligase n=1 Tax=Maridesulfovibrio hydrothermalis AM13 = DSM 14728 TaxID=1121451 RepID=L0RCP3_9BACT|nr:isoleucine--tRNA ligase [Maridesulfovibrio hydrothermalis]CCO24519.1 isoleucyl-tRNA synthetase [Maridesulfovibrio hydrothermalis AM13 = DSM 14728]
MSDYKKTLCLPKTKFPMKANLKQREPEMLKRWEEISVYDKMVEANADAEKYVLHDGPPYANGHIHMGTAMNKVLKDIIVKSRNLQGMKAEYVPGWDCHGLPIEHKVEQDLKKKKKELPTLIIRKLCREYARKFVDIQRKEFKRLGVMGNWENPYLTMKPEYEAATARELGRFMESGSVVRGKKPIHWCCDCRTALAEAEVEYEDHTSPSIYVRFPLNDEKVLKALPEDVASKVDLSRTYVCIWTTTPWTIPDNMAVAVHPEFDYCVAEVNGDIYILAERLLPVCAETFGWEKWNVLATVAGAKLEGAVAKHPFYDRESPVVLADYVTLDSGTGVVHTAPGHGREDFETGNRYGLEVYSPMNNEGVFLKDVEFFAGMKVFDANPKVIEKLEEVGNLLAKQNITHSYPHCWRCKEPVIFRATTQWFISMEENDLRKKALKAIRDDVKWLPAWGEDRIFKMVENRPDWCISRQRNWGVPIIALICQDCDEVYNESDWVFSIVDKFEKHETGCDYWFEKSVEELAPKDLKCPKCGGNHWAKEDDILDVWFDSGTSFAAVVEKRPEHRFPADLYLEGSDQHRGWFHSSLLVSVGNRDTPPYKTVLTHGYVVDKNGRKMSKSIGNVIAPQEIIDQHGAEILRMWVSAVNYQEDVRISDEILSRMVDTYRRVRNTCRYILGNLDGFNPEADAVAVDELLPIDHFALDLVKRQHEVIQKAYTDFEFHKVYHTLHNLCTTELSSFYLDIIKDRLYVSGEKSLERRSAQTILWQTMLMLLKDMAPILSFTAEEAYSHMSAEMKGDAETVFAFRPQLLEPVISDDERSSWELLMDVRNEVTKAIEPLRREKVIGHSLDTKITLFADETIIKALENVELREYFIVSGAEIKPLSEASDDAVKPEELEGLLIKVEKSEGEKCSRCWRYDTLGTNADHPELCPRCAAVLTGE